MKVSFCGGLFGKLDKSITATTEYEKENYDDAKASTESGEAVKFSICHFDSPPRLLNIIYVQLNDMRCFKSIF